MVPDEQSGGDQKAATARAWIARLYTSERWRENYLTRCRRIVRRYRNDTFNENSTLTPEARRFAILWSNVQTIGPAIYARTPEAVVTRRYKDDDKTSRIAAEVLERALNFSLDQYDFDDKMRLSRDDYLLLAQGVMWVRYVPHEQVNNPQTTDEGELPLESEPDDGLQVTDTADSEGKSGVIVYQEAVCDHVNFTDFGLEVCRSWDEAGYVWRRVYMTRAELVKRFGPIGKKVPLDWSPKPDEQEDPSDEKIKKSAVYEIWDKTTGKVFWINRSFPEQCLDERADPLGLTDFFPCPRPLTGTLAPDGFIPIPDYVYYQDQAEEVDELTQRIGTLTDALRMVGIYAGEENTLLQNVFSGTNNTLIPVDSMAALSDKGGLKGVIEWLPVDMVIEVLKGCFEARRQILEDIYQITGISDIIRGQSDPNETATAQGIKQQWGGLRVKDRQKEVARFARDILRIKAEIIAKRFTVETLKKMTDVKLLTAEEKQQMQMVMQLGQQNPQVMQQFASQLQLMDKPTWEEVTALLRDDALRTFLVDVETDSTVEPNESEEKQRRVEYITAMSQFLGAALPVLQSYPKAAPLIAESVKFLNRGFRVGREMEDVLEKTFAEVAQMPPQQEGSGDPNAPEVAKTELETEKIKQQGQLQAKQMDMQMMQQEMPLRQAEQQLKLVALQRDPQPQSIA